VFGTTSGHIFALDAATGLDMPNFPFETQGRILAPVLLDRVVKGHGSMQAVVLSFDGHLYIVDGVSGTAMLPLTPVPFFCYCGSNGKCCALVDCVGVIAWRLSVSGHNSSCIGKFCALIDGGSGAG
jgi:hypothetical protein